MDGFSPQLTRDVSQALHEFLLTDEAACDAQFRDLTTRVCVEAHAMGLPPEKMLIAIKQLLDRAPLPDDSHLDDRRQALERFISGCIKAYFGAR